MPERDGDELFPIRPISRSASPWSMERGQPDADRLLTALRRTRATALKQLSAMWWIVGAIEIGNMESNSGVLCEGMEKLFKQFRIEITHLVAAESNVPYEEGATGNINRGSGHHFVHRQVHIGIAGDALLIAKRLLEGLTKGNYRCLQAVW